MVIYIMLPMVLASIIDPLIIRAVALEPTAEVLAKYPSYAGSYLYPYELFLAAAVSAVFILIPRTSSAGTPDASAARSSPRWKNDAMHAVRKGSARKPIKMKKIQMCSDGVRWTGYRNACDSAVGNHGVR